MRHSALSMVKDIPLDVHQDSNLQKFEYTIIRTPDNAIINRGLCSMYVRDGNQNPPNFWAQNPICNPHSHYGFEFFIFMTFYLKCDRKKPKEYFIVS